MPAGLHPFVQDANNLHHAGLPGAIVHDVYGLLDETRAAIRTDMSQVQAAYTWKEDFPIPGDRAFWIRCNQSHGGHQHRGVPTPALVTPSLGARCEDPLEIGQRRAGEPKSRHRISARAVTVVG